MRPMLATPAPPPGAPPSGPGWLHEVKWDGMRVIADVHDGGLKLFSRNEADVTVSFPELLPLSAALADAELDGEVVALVDGTPSFAALAERMHVRDARRAAALAERVPVTLVLFDLLRLYGVELLRRPVEERRASLERLELPPGPWQVPPSYTDGAALAAATLEQGLEGVVSKRLGSRYQPGRRSRDWVKAPHRTTGTVVVGGWRPLTGSTRQLGALLVGLPDAQGRLVFVGRVGSGLSGAVAADLAARLAPHARDTSPFDEPLPRADAVGTSWVEPLVCVDVRHLGHGAGGRLRQPVVRGVRADLTPDDLLPGDPMPR
jgi:bifunctional non-homologous end joining protein LigD